MLTPQALRYLHIGVHLSQQLSQPGSPSRHFSNGTAQRQQVRRKTEDSQKRARSQLAQVAACVRA